MMMIWGNKTALGGDRVDFPCKYNKLQTLFSKDYATRSFKATEWIKREIIFVSELVW